jgi:isoamylase
VFASGPDFRHIDSAPFAAKAIALGDEAADLGAAPTRALRDDIIYEVHVRGLTRNDPGVPAALRGTYAGAALKADYLADLGVTAIELLPIQETQDDQNDLEVGTAGDNYWGYATLSFFAPDRRFAADRSPGGPTREFQAMVRAFHDRGIKVYLDVVYNPTGEGGLWNASGEVAELLSFRGLDNATYYELAGGGRFYHDNNGVAGNVNVADPAVRDLVIDSLAYWHRAMGVDGFRFDLAAVLGNRCTTDCFQFDKLESANILNRAVRSLPVRPEAGGAGVDLIAEPWAIGAYEMGNFPSGWAEWNGTYRDALRADQNLLGVETVTPGELATRIAGSSDLFQDDGRKPWHSINFLVAHDGFTLKDLYSCSGKNNGQAWPFGPSDGGEDHNRSWDHGGDPAAQRQAARTGLALLMLSAGVPMMTGGDEFLRSQRCNNNAYNLDSEGNWLDWNAASGQDAFTRFVRGLMRFRASHPALRPADFFRGRDRDGNGLKDITWLRDDGGEADPGYMAAGDRHFLAYRLDGGDARDTAASIYVAYNGWSGPVAATLPPARAGKSWYRVADTAAWMESLSNFENTPDQDRLDGTRYQLAGRSLLLLVER